jgi:N-acetylglucosaminyldiphosphoundecaprenol N-acetyl-beta-D-mannosaminyltransferase
MIKKPTLPLPKTSPKHGKILGINVSSTHKREVLSFFETKVARQEKFLVVTPNPEIIVQAQRDRKLTDIINTAALAIPDGVGLGLAWRFLGLPGSLELIKGRELFLDLLKLSDKNGWRTFFLGDKTVFATKQKLSSSFSKVKIQAAEGPWLDSDASPISERESVKEQGCIAKINKFKPHLLFVGFGAPKQEKWVSKWLPKLSTQGVVVVGGTFDYIAGKAALPPEWMDKSGLEWLWRLINQPSRLGRVINAVFVFPLKVLLEKAGI